ncbi:MAG: hypothetical protein JXR05_15185 [Flavobacteriaceae bacterium]
MKKYKVITFLIIILTYYSCNNKKQDLQKEYKAFKSSDLKKSDNLKAIEVTEISKELLFPVGVTIAKEKMIINDAKSEKPLHIISLPEESYVGNFGSIGAGPGEILVPWSVSVSEDGLVGVFDPRQKKIIKFNIDTLILKNTFINEHKLPVGIDGLSVLIHNDNIYSLYGGENKYILNETNIISNEVKRYGAPNKLFDDVDDRLKIELFRTKMNISNDILAITYINIPQIEIFNLKNKKWNKISGPDNFTPKLRKANGVVTFVGDQNIAYTGVKVTDKFIYALYNGRNEQGIKGEHSNRIFVFDFEGVLVKEYVLDRKIAFFDVYKDSYIYGVNLEMVPALLKFKL